MSCFPISSCYGHVASVTLEQNEGRCVLLESKRACIFHSFVAVVGRVLDKQGREILTLVVGLVTKKKA